MAERRGLLKRWRCARLRSSLVDGAEGALDERARARIERHVADCDECRAALEALRDVPQALRRAAVPQPDEDFFRRQRQAILRRARQAPSPQAAPPFRPRFGWAAGLATAAVVVLVLLRQGAGPPVPLPQGTPVEGLSADDVADLADLTLAADADLVDPADLADETPAVGEASLDDAEEWALGPPEMRDLNDQELERLEDLIG